MPRTRRAVAAAVLLLAVACRGGEDEAATPPADRPSTTTGSAAGPAAVRLRPDGIGAVSFGAAEAEARAALTAAFGPAGFEESLPADSCATGATRRLSWSDLQVLMGPGGAGRPTLVGWTYGTADPPAEPLLTTAEGIGVGSTVAQVRSAYAGVEVTEDTDAGVVRFSAQAGSPPRPLDGVLTGSTDTATVRALYAGSYCQER